MRLVFRFVLLTAIVSLTGALAGASDDEPRSKRERGELHERSSKKSFDRNRIVGTRRDDELPGTPGDDLILGRRGDDLLQGRGGDDRMRGGRGEDRLESSLGDDVLVGGRDEDTFYVEFGSSRRVVIRDFDVEEDRLLVGGGVPGRLGKSNLQGSRSGTTLVLSNGTEELEIVFRGVRKRKILRKAIIEFERDFPGYGNLQILALYDDSLAHEGPVFLEESEELVFTSNRLIDDMGEQFVVVSSYDTDSGKTKDLGLSDAIPMANGATRARSGDIIFCRQGNFTFPAGLSRYDPESGQVSDVVSGVDGLQFNSPNDVVESSRGEILFTDPQYGFEQKFRPPPQLGNWVWLYDPSTENFTVLADDLSRPNGIAFSNDERYLYVTDSGWAVGDGTTIPGGPRNVYRYRINRGEGGVSLSDRQLLASAEVEIADGVKVDAAGNVWYSTGAGLHALGPGGLTLGAVAVPGGAANFVITEEGIFVMGETALYLLRRAEDSDHD